jgi:hypothetical protein
MNKLVQRVLNSTLKERRLVGKNLNWTEVLGSVGGSINAAAGRGKNDVPAYAAVYGQTYDHDILCSKDEARRCWNVPQRLQVSPMLQLGLSLIWCSTNNNMCCFFR